MKRPRPLTLLERLPKCVQVALLRGDLLDSGDQWTCRITVAWDYTYEADGATAGSAIKAAVALYEAAEGK